MAHAQTPLGDSHNFGRRVSQHGARIVKPRTLLWEWLVLSAESPLRRLLDEAARRDGLEADAFGLPDLAFSSPGARAGGEVERVELAALGTLSGNEKRSLAQLVGRALALWSWLGVSDLHWENLVLGRAARGHLVFAPLDVEMVLADLSLPTETKLLADADPEYAAICRHAAGVRRVLPYLGKPLEVADLLTIAGAYRATLAFLDRHARAIADVLAALPRLHETPIRVLLRATGEYVGQASESLWPPLLDAEREQLARGDIPYFFRLYGRPGIHYFADEALARIVRLPTRGDVPQLDPMLRLSRGLRSPTRKKLRDEGLFTVFGAFDHPSFVGHHAGDALAATFDARTLVLTFSSGEALHTRRDLSRFVGSAYLPCACGEVRSVFVPAVTRCEPARAL